MGHGRMDRLRRRRVEAIARSCRRARLQFLDTAFATDGQERRSCSAKREASRREKVVHRHEGAAEESHVAWPRRDADRDVFRRHIIEMTEKSPRQSRGPVRSIYQQLMCWKRDAGLKRDGMETRGWGSQAAENMIDAFGHRVNRWEPANVIKALRTGLRLRCRSSTTLDQNPEDETVPSVVSSTSR